MRLSWSVFASAALLSVTACRGFPFFWKAEPTQAVPTTESVDGAAQVRVELQDIHYDGWSLRGRLLVTAESGRLRLDKRLIESTSLNITSLTDCQTGRPVEFMVLDVLAKPPREEEVLTLAPGYWYGKHIRLPLRAQGPDQQPGPACIHADIAFHTLGPLSVHFHVRAEVPAQSEAESPTGASRD